MKGIRELMKGIDFDKLGKTEEINDMKNRIMCKKCPLKNRKWEDVKDCEALRNHNRDIHNLEYCKRCFKNVKGGEDFI